MASRRGARRFQASYPTMEQINSEGITKLALDNWATNHDGQNAKKPFNLGIVRDIYADIVAGRFSSRRLILLDYSQYLEQYLWPNFNVETSQFTELAMSVVALVNVKKRERVPVWDAFKEKPEFFPLFFKSVMDLCLTSSEPPGEENAQHRTVSLVEQCQLLLFLSHSVNSLEEDLIREQAQRIFGLPVWLSLSPKRLEVEIKKVPNLKKLWDKLLKKEQQKDEAAKKAENFYRFFMRSLMEKFQSALYSVPKDGPLAPGLQSYCEHFLTLMIDCQSALNTRRFFHAVLDDAHALVKCRLSPLFGRPEGRVFSQLVEALEFYSSYEITLTGNDMTEQERSTDHYNRMTALQRTIYSSFPDQEWSKKFATSAVFKLDSREALQTFFTGMNMDQLRQIADRIGVLGSSNIAVNAADSDGLSKAILCEVLVEYHEKRISMLERVNDMPIYPTEDMIWDEALVPEDIGNTAETMPLPKLHLQFLSLHDYLLRNFQLFRLESAYEIRTDIEDVVARMKPWKNDHGGVVFGGWARMALPVNHFEIWDVGKPHVGCKQPSRVRAKVTITLNVRDNIKSEWEHLRKHDVCFLITVKPTRTYGTPLDHQDHFINQTGLTYVRGCEIEGMLDDRGNLIDELTNERPQLHGETRTFRVWMDPNQYYLDAGNHANAPTENIYKSFNIIMRRRPEENNFKAVLETIRNLINSEWMVPDWLHDVLLGYGDPESAHWTRMPNKLPSLDFNDTFLSVEHVKACFLDQPLEFHTPKNLPMEPPFRLTFPVDSKDGGTKRTAEGEVVTAVPKTLVVEPYEPRRNSPYGVETAKKNAVPFTPTQLEAIISGMQPGLTLVVGPPGTGKTDVAVQIISNIYHNFPEQRTLIVTHSNQALNQLFEKIMHLDIDERHLLRLGHGEEALETTKDFSRYGRVNYVLSKRLELLSEVSRLQTCLRVPGDVGYTCETAGHFYLYQVLKRWQDYKASVKRLSSSPTSPEEIFRDAQVVRDFHASMASFFPEAPQPIFDEGQGSLEKNLNTAELCFRYIDNIFTQLEEFRPFELLRSGLDRTRYLLTKEAKIIAMTCTHAGMKRQELVELGFKYDNVLMEEAAQILEVETFIPLLLQKPEHGVNRLKRWIMIGDHNQLPPIVQNKVFEKYCNMEQSLFTRFVRLGMPTVDLDAQGRMRPSLCQLFSWRYKRLGNLPHTYRMPAFLTANAGFAYDYQLINVEDFNGIGESEPSAHFVQNLAEAEYIAATFMYMRLLGYPAESISILSTYNGQKHLIRDVLEKRCGSNPLIGMPHKVATVDKYQGQQNDYVLLSLVRTKTIGYLRDARRMVVALSRARLGLYIFGRVPLFKNSLELSPAFSVLLQRPTKFHLIPNESFPTERTLEATQSDSMVVMKDMPEMMSFVYRLYEQKVQLLRPLPHQEKDDGTSEDEDDEEAAPVTSEVVIEDEQIAGAIKDALENPGTSATPAAPAAGPQQFIPRSDLPFFPIRGDRGMTLIQDDAGMDEEEAPAANEARDGKEGKEADKN